MQVVLSNAKKEVILFLKEYCINILLITNIYFTAKSYINILSQTLYFIMQITLKAIVYSSINNL